MNAGVHRVNSGVHRVNSGVHRVNSGVHRVNSGVHRVNSGIHRVSAGVHRVNGGVHRVNAGVHTDLSRPLSNNEGDQAQKCLRFIKMRVIWKSNTKLMAHKIILVLLVVFPSCFP